MANEDLIYQNQGTIVLSSTQRMWCFKCAKYKKTENYVKVQLLKIENSKFISNF